MVETNPFGELQQSVVLAGGARLPGRRRLPVVLIGNALLRIASSAGGILIGLYLADLANRGQAVDALIVGALAAVSFIVELIAALPMGVASDAVAPRALLVTSAVLGAIAAQLFGLSGLVTVFFLARALEGLAGAAGGPSLLAHITDVTEGDDALRGKAMSFYELSLLGGLALGGVVGSALWRALGTGAFAAVSAVYLLAGALWAYSAVGSRKHGASQALGGLVRAAKDPGLQRLAPAWLCINAIVGLWLGPTITFLLTLDDRNGQFLTGLFASQPELVGVVLLGYALIFAAGVTIWSFFIGRFLRKTVLTIALTAMLFVCLGLFLLNQSSEWPAWTRIALVIFTAACIMVESGFTPAALSLLADTVGAQNGRGAAMGIYNVLLSLGALAGSLIGGVLAQRFFVNGIIFGTLAMALIALVTVRFIPTAPLPQERHA